MASPGWRTQPLVFSDPHVPLRLSTHPAGLHVVQPEGLARALVHHVELVSVSHADEIVTLFGRPVD